jgi:hypothetical protein
MKKNESSCAALSYSTRFTRAAYPSHTSGMSYPHQLDIILDRYMPDASAEEREAAAQNLMRFIAVVTRIGKRIRSEIRQNTDSALDSESPPHTL